MLSRRADLSQINPSLKLHFNTNLSSVLDNYLHEAPSFLRTYSRSAGQTILCPPATLRYVNPRVTFPSSTLLNHSQQSPWWWKQQPALKHMSISVRLDGVISQDTSRFQFNSTHILQFFIFPKPILILSTRVSSKRLLLFGFYDQDSVRHF